MRKKPLPTVTLNEKTWEFLLANMKHIVKVDSLADYKCGYKEKNVVYYTRGDDSDTMIIKTMYVKYLTEKDYDFLDGWKQLVCIKRPEQVEDAIFNAINPVEALNRTNYMLKKRYSEEELEECYKSHEAEEDSATIIKENILYGAGLEKYKIYKFSDCLYEDMNGAYNSMLAEIFPRCSEDFKWLNDHRHDNNDRLKNQSNYFVGCMTQNAKKYKDGKPTRPIHPKTRFWIVSQITAKMYSRMKNVGGKALYVNTDGFIVQHPKKILETSDKMGEFKRESYGDVYFFRCNSGWCMQYMKKGKWEIKGLIPLELRDKIDLSKGLAIDYDIETTDTGRRMPINIKENRYEIIEIN